MAGETLISNRLVLPTHRQFWLESTVHCPVALKCFLLRGKVAFQ